MERLRVVTLNIWNRQGPWRERLPLIREKTGLPVGVGFGIRDAVTAARIARIADAVVVGSRIIEEIEKSTAETACGNVRTLVAEIRRGVDEVNK